jgi:hypothetical protein
VQPQSPMSRTALNCAAQAQLLNVSNNTRTQWPCRCRNRCLQGSQAAHPRSAHRIGHQEEGLHLKPRTQTSRSTSRRLWAEMLMIVQPGLVVRFMIVLRLGRDCPRGAPSRRAERSRPQRRDRGIMAGTRVLAGWQPFMPRKPAAAALTESTSWYADRIGNYVFNPAPTSTPR